MGGFDHLYCETKVFEVGKMFFGSIQILGNFNLGRLLGFCIS